MRIDQKGSQDGVTVKQFKKGEVYSITDRLADVFIGENWADEVTEPEVITPEIIEVNETLITPEAITKPKKKLKRKKVNVD